MDEFSLLRIKILFLYTRFSYYSYFFNKNEYLVMATLGRNMQQVDIR